MQSSASNPFELPIHDGSIDLSRGVVRRGNSCAPLTPTELALLGYLNTHPGEVIRKETLLTEVWGYRPGLTTRAVDMAVFKLRRKIESDPERPTLLVSVRGLGLALHLAPAHRPAPRANVEIPADVGIPAEFDAFVGRHAELAALSSAIRDPGLVTVVGPGGIGKTRLATRVAREEAEAGRTVVFSDLTHAQDCGALLRSVARSLDVPLGADAIDQLGRAIAARGPLLVVLDNLEQLAGELQPLDRWRELSPQVTFLGTSRIPLGRRGERLVPLGGLARRASVELLTARAASRGTTIEQDPGLDALAAQLDDLPLSLELAAMRLGACSAAELVTRTEALLDLRAVGVNERHGSLRTVLDGSWQLLESHEQAGLAKLSVFRGGFTLLAAEHVLGDHDRTGLELIDTLYDHGWIRRDGSRFRLLETARVYAEQRLCERPELRADAERAHGEHFAGFGTPAAILALRTRDAPRHLRRFADDIDNLEQAAVRAIARGDVAVAVDAALGTCAYLYRAGSDAVQVALLERVIALEPAGTARARVLLQLGFAQLMSSPERAWTNFVEARAASEAAGATLLASHAERGIGATWMRLQRPEEAAEVFARGAQRHDGARVDHLRGLVGALQALDRLEEALALSTEVRAGYDALGDDEQVVMLDAVIATMLVRRGEVERARSLLSGALEQALVRTPRGATFIQSELGRVEQLRGDLMEAIRHHREANARLERIGHTIQQGYALIALSEALTASGAHEEALTTVDRARALLPASLLALPLGRCLTVRGQALIGLAKPDQAVPVLELAHTTLLGSEYPLHAFVPACALVLAHFAAGDPVSGRAALAAVEEQAEANAPLEPTLAMALRTVRSLSREIAGADR